MGVAFDKQDLSFLFHTLKNSDPLGCDDYSDAIGHFIREIPDADRHWAMKLAPAPKSLDDILTTVGGNLQEFLSVHEVAHTRHIHSSADEGCHLQSRLERERPAYHSGVIKFVNAEEKFGIIGSDAGRSHIFLEE